MLKFKTFHDCRLKLDLFISGNQGDDEKFYSLFIIWFRKNLKD